MEGTGDEAYTNKYMKAKLQEHFGDKIIIATIKNVANVVTFQQTASSLIHEFYCQPRNDDEDETKRIIETAARLIKSDIKNIYVSGDVYPTSAKMSTIEETLNFVPDLLQIFLRTLFVGKSVNLKLASVGQAIVQAVRPRVILAPLQLGLGVEMHHHFASKFLIDSKFAWILCLLQYRQEIRKKCRGCTGN